MASPISPASAGHRARKRFGQNFLQDPQVIEQIVRQGQFQPADPVVEIGPGLGALTGALLQQLDHLTVIELDRDLATHLPARVSHPQKLQVIQADALSFDFARLAGDMQPAGLPAPGLRIIGNLPYNISTPILFHLLTFGPAIRDMQFMLQKEVVDRIVAQPDSGDYGRLSVMMQYACRPEFLMDVPPEAFDPAPKVNSAVFRLVPHAVKPVQAQNERHFSQLVNQLFSQRRKTLRGLLKGQIDSEGLEALGLNPLARPENLSVADFVRLSDELCRLAALAATED